MSKRGLLTFAAVGGLLALATGAALADSGASQIPATGQKMEGAPNQVKMPWGTFTLAPRIAEKIRGNLCPFFQSDQISATKTTTDFKMGVIDFSQKGTPQLE